MRSTSPPFAFNNEPLFSAIPASNLGAPKILKTLYALACLWIISTPVTACAADWVPLGDRSYIDSSSISSIGNGKKKAWVKILFSPPQPGGDITKYRDFSSTVSLAYLDCRKRTFFLKQIYYFSDTDETIGSGLWRPSDNDYQDIPPESVAEMMFNYMCKPKPAPRHNGG